MVQYFSLSENKGYWLYSEFQALLCCYIARWLFVFLYPNFCHKKLIETFRFFILWQELCTICFSMYKLCLIDSLFIIPHLSHFVNTFFEFFQTFLTTDWCACHCDSLFILPHCRAVVNTFFQFFLNIFLMSAYCI